MDVAVVGAGMAGLTAARALTQAGHNVIVVDQGRYAGGRLSTEVFANGGRADAGAQFFTVRTNEFTPVVARWQTEGLVFEWCKGFSSDDGNPRYAVRGGMVRLVMAMTDGLDVRSSTRVDQIHLEPHRVVVAWSAIHGPDAGRLTVDAVIVTAPVPQTKVLLGAGIPVPAISYDPTMTLMVALDREVEISKSGGLQLTQDPVWSFIADNKAKGTSLFPVITFHSTSEFARSRLNARPAVVADELLHAARPFLRGIPILETRRQQWQYATPVEPFPERTFSIAPGRIILAGDAFGGPRIEGAFLSGLAAADQVVLGG